MRKCVLSGRHLPVRLHAKRQPSLIISLFLIDPRKNEEERLLPSTSTPIVRAGQTEEGDVLDLHLSLSLILTLLWIWFGSSPKEHVLLKLLMTLGG
jgi:hypothetical protein